jgi:hypothetical protein
MDKDSGANQDRRRFKRSPLSTRVAVFRDGQFTFEASVEVGEGGMCLEVKNFYSVGEMVQVIFFTSPSTYVMTEAEIVYKMNSDPQKYVGLRFLQPTSRDQESIRHYVANHKI